MDWQDRLFALRQRGRALARRFDARPRRERMLLLLTLAAFTLLAGDRLWLTPAFREFQAASQLLAAAQTDQKALADESEHRRVLGDAERRALEAEVAQRRQRATEGAKALAEAQAGLIGPGQMVGLLQRMLPQQHSVRVVSLKTLAPQDSRAPASAASVPLASGEGGSLYRHGVEITVEGAYGDLMDYLSSLENLPGPRLLWGGVRLKVERHPTVQLSLTVYTLSLDRAWLEL
jgi:MSHA biogenesis protein MshJ